MTVNRGRAFADHLGIGQSAEGFGIQLGNGRCHTGGRIGTTKDERRAQNGLIALGKRTHRAQHCLIPH